MLEPLEVGNNQHQVLQLEPLEGWYHRELVLVLGYYVFMPVLVIPIIVLLFILVNYGLCFSLWFQLLLLVPMDDQVECFQYIVDFCSLL